MAEQTDQTPRAEPKDRADIARWIIGVSGVVLIGLTVTLIRVNGVEGSKTAFNMLVPMIGTWIGTVIAYYFSGENFQRASDSVNRMVGQVIADKLKSITVREAMLRRGVLTVIKLPPNGDASTISLKNDVLDRFNDTVTRLPVLDSNDVAKYIIHQSVIFEFVARKTMAPPPAAPVNISNLTLKDFLDFNQNADFVSRTMAFVGIGQALSDAKANMDAIKDCQDVFVTDGGAASEPVRGWLPNVEIARRARV
jgi:hypothetical protein